MRYYELMLPNDKTPHVLTAIRKLRNLPEGTIITCVFTERDGSPIEAYNVPVVNGKAEIQRRKNVCRS